jgi:hypothetical protein
MGGKVEIRDRFGWIFACICVSHGLDERMEKISDRSGEFLGYVDGIDSWNTWVHTVSLYRRSRRYIQVQRSCG